MSLPSSDLTSSRVHKIPPPVPIDIDAIATSPRPSIDTSMAAHSLNRATISCQNSQSAQHILALDGIVWDTHEPLLLTSSNPDQHPFLIIQAESIFVFDEEVAPSAGPNLFARSFLNLTPAPPSLSIWDRTRSWVSQCFFGISSVMCGVSGDD